MINLFGEPEHRAQDVAVLLACVYAGFTIPAVAVGLSSESLGTKDATLSCAIVIGGLAVIALAVLRHSRDVT